MDYAALLSDALKKPVVRERPVGCCRVYVSICDDGQAKEIAKAARKLGLDFQKRSYYGAKNALYIGYDNLDGKELARGSAVVAALEAAGIACYRVENGD